MANKWSDKLKSFLIKILLFTVGIIILALVSFVFDSLGLIEGSSDGDPVDLIWQIFWAVVGMVGIFIIFAVIYEVWKNRKK